MKIIFILNHFLPDTLAGIELYTFKLAGSLQAAGAGVAVLIPFFDSKQSDEYYYEGIRVIRYAENSRSDRDMIMGKTIPQGLAQFKNILEQERPDIVHFQELAAGRGIGMYHLEAVKSLQIKILLTCHLSTYSCQTGNLMYKDEKICDGIIRRSRCTICSYHAREITGIKAGLLAGAAKVLYASGINATGWNATVGTALGFPFLIDKKKQELTKIAALCNKIVVLTHWYGQILEANAVPAEKIFYCPQGLTGSVVKYIGTKAKLPLRLAFIGRVSKYKGVHLLLKAFQQLAPDKILLDIYGPVTEDEYAAGCRQQSAEMPNVHWMGAIASEKVVNILSAYDLLCLPSTFSEMSPLVIPEAFAAGIPVLASNVYGNAEQIKDGVNGWLFDFKDVPSLKKKLETLIAHPELIDAAKKNLPAPRPFDTIADEHVDMYRTLLAEKATEFS